MVHLTLTQARAELPTLLSRVQQGEEVTITRHGHAVAVLVHPDALRTRRAQSALDAADRLHVLMESARSDDLAASPGLSVARAEELAAEVRAARDSS